MQMQDQHLEVEKKNKKDALRNYFALIQNKLSEEIIRNFI